MIPFNETNKTPKDTLNKPLDCDIVNQTKERSD